MVSKYLSDSVDLDDYSKEGFKMKANQRSANIDIKEKISILWIVVMINMIFADILSFMLPGFLNDINTGNTPFGITQEILLVFALILEIPIVMIFLSRILKNKFNRWANIIASLITIIFGIGGGSLALHYIFFATVEVLVLLLIIRYAWELK